jgi:hypothetical protein
MKCFPSRIRTRQKTLLSRLLFNIVPDALSRTVGQLKEIKGIQIGEEEVRLSIFTDDMITYIENPKEFH